MATDKKRDYKNPMHLGVDLAIAAGGGVAAELVADFINSKAPDWVANNPKLAEIVPAAAAGAALYFSAGTKMAPYVIPAAFGAAGAVGAGFSDDLIAMSGLSGFSRNNKGMNGTEADEYRKGIAYIEEMQRKGFEGSGIQGFSSPGQMSNGWG